MECARKEKEIQKRIDRIFHKKISGFALIFCFPLDIYPFFSILGGSIYQEDQFNATL
jgi:hypothetical protein